MSLDFNKTDIYSIEFNGVNLTQVNFNGTPVWYALTSCIISGKAIVGETLTANTVPSEVQDMCTYQWYRGTSEISGANKNTYTTSLADRGYQLKCVVTIGEASVSSSYTDIIRQTVESISISGSVRSGYTLNTMIVPEGATGTYQWYRDSSIITGATSSSYTAKDIDIDKTIKCVFTANGNYSGSVSNSTSTTVVQDTFSVYRDTGYKAFYENVSSSYTLASNQVATKITCNASVYNHTTNGETALVKAYIYWDGSDKAAGPVNSASYGNWAYSSCSWSGNVSGKTIYIGSAGEGTSFGRQATGTISGYYIHD